MIESREDIRSTDDLVLKALPECVLNYSKFSTGKEKQSVDLLYTILDVYCKEDKLSEFVDVLSSGFSVDESLSANTIYALQAVMRTQGKNLSISCLDYLLDQVLMFLTQKSRSLSKAALVYLIVYIKIVPISIVGRHLENIVSKKTFHLVKYTHRHLHFSFFSALENQVKSLSAMTKDTKCYCRKEIGYFLKKICKNFTTAEVVKYVPGDDAVTHKRLKKIRKLLHREGRKKKEKKSDDDNDEDAGDFFDRNKSRSDT